MDSTFKRIIAIAIGLIVVAAIASALVLASGQRTGSDDPLADAKNGAVNVLIDLSGIKQHIDSEVRAKAGKIAEEAGIPQAIVETAIDSLAIPDWEATSLPDDAVETGTFNVQTDELDARVTTYDDPGIVTINAYGQNVTMAVPETAQGYLSLLGYLQKAS